MTSTGRQLHDVAGLSNDEGATSVLVPLRGDAFTTAGAILPPMATLRLVQ